MRLPKYLLDAGRADEAWSEYNRMLNEGITGKRPSEEMVYMEHSKIYASMSGHLKKDKKHFQSAVFDAMSRLAWFKGLIAQNRNKELDKYNLEEKSFMTEIKKAGCEDIWDEFISEVNNALKKPESTNCAELSRRLNELPKSRG